MIKLSQTLTEAADMPESIGRAEGFFPKETKEEEQT